MGIYENAEFGSGSDLPWVIVNMVATIDGKAVPPSEEYRLFASQPDWEAMLDLRAAADAIGQGTVTAMPLKPKQFSSVELLNRRKARDKDSPPLVVIFSNGHNLDPRAQIFSRPEILRPTVLLPATGTQALGDLLEDRADILTAGKDRLDLRRALELLRARGIRLLTIEGGPHLNGSLLAAGLVNELFLTISPQIFGNAAPLTIVEGPLLKSGLVKPTLTGTTSVGEDHFLRYSISYRD